MLPEFVSRGVKLLVSFLKKIFRRDEFGVSWWESKRLERSPKLAHTHAHLLGRRITLTDASWYLFSYREIFKEEIYRFNIDSPSPLIIDCGANIGLSLIYFKHLYPDARIVAFEPDGEIFGILEQNIKTFHFKNITLYAKAVWTSETELSFQPDGAVGGRLTQDGAINVKTLRLKNFINQKVDFLKIDIEGAEYEVLKDCKDYLGNVDHLFVEHHGNQNAEENLNEILQIIRNAGFRYYLKEASPVKHPFIRQERGVLYPLQLNIFAFRN
jgi:FkbM family methyltransferase